MSRYYCNTTLDSILSDGRFLVFVGYSANDFFDVNVYFGSKSKNEFFRTKAVFHPHTNATQPTLTVQRLMRCFGDTRYHPLADTTEFLSGLNNTGPAFDDRSDGEEWKKGFKRQVNDEYLDKIRPLLVCSMCNVLGISVDSVDRHVYCDAVSLEHLFDEHIFHDILASVGHHRGRVEDDMDHTKRAGASLLGSYYCFGDYERAVAYAKCIDQLVKEIKDSSKELQWHTCTSFQTYCALLLSKYAYRPYLATALKQDRGLLEQLSKISNAIERRSYRSVQSVIQVAIALRNKCLLDAVLTGEANDQTDRKVFDLYKETSRLDGFTAQFMTVALKNLFLAKRTGSMRHLIRSYKNTRRCKNFSKTIGDLIKSNRATVLTFMLLLSLPTVLLTKLYRNCRRVWAFANRVFSL